VTLGSLDDSDLDRLADHIAGVLDPLASSELATLIATDPRWSAAFAELTAAQETLPLVLAEEAARTAEPTPDHVLARIHDAVARTSTIDASTVEPMRPVRIASTRTTSAPTGPARRRTAARRWLPRLAGAAAVVVLCGGMVKLVQGSSITSSPSAESAVRPGAAPIAVAPSRQLGAGASGSTIGELATGTDYRLDTLAPLTRALLHIAPPPAANSAVVGPGSDASTRNQPLQAQPAPSVPGGAFSASDLASRGLTALSRFLGDTALAECTNDVSQSHPGRTIFVDFAKFDGYAALILIVEAPEGGLTAVAVSPKCGLGGGADELGAARVA
jgi:hypothetical protein